MDCANPGSLCKGQPPCPPCPRCGGPTCRIGYRIVAQVSLGPDMAPFYDADQARLRLLCLNRECSPRSFTVYEDEGYPHRTYRLAVVEAAVAMLATVPGATLSSVARAFGCHRRTIGRWVHWLSDLASPAELSRLCQRADPSGLPAPRALEIPGFVGLAAHIILLLEHLARLLRHAGVRLLPGVPLLAILRHQFDRFRLVCHLTRGSPGLRVA